MRPIVRPGLRILRRDLHTVQLGLDWPGVGSLRETPALRAVLDSIDGFRDAAGVLMAATSSGLADDECAAALAVLVDSGAVVNHARGPVRDVGEPTWSSLWLLAGPAGDANGLLDNRSTTVVWIDGTGQVADSVRDLLKVARLRVCHDAEQATIVVVAADGEPDRDRADRAMQSGLPHLWVYVRELVGVVGPFVLPGRTACLRCVDSARADLDPAWPTLLQSIAAKPLPVEPCDPVLATLVAAWATQEVALWASEIAPQTHGQIIEVPQGCGPVDVTRFEVHPHCGCGWAVWRDTIGA